MPFIHIRSLPQPEAVDTRAALKQIGQNACRFFECKTQHISVTWQFFEPGHYLADGETADEQTPQSHPLLVDLVLPDFYTLPKRQQLLRNVASMIAEETGISESNIFIQLQLAHSGQIFDAGRIPEWG